MTLGSGSKPTHSSESRTAAAARSFSKYVKSIALSSCQVASAHVYRTNVRYQHAQFQHRVTSLSTILQRLRATGASPATHRHRETHLPCCTVFQLLVLRRNH